MAIMPDIQNSPTMEKNQYFKSLDYHSREEAKARLAEFLMTQDGWKVFEYRGDKSDAMSDYYCPADWGGIATFGDFTLVVDVRDAHAGHEIMKEIRITEPCEHCLETGEEPNGWTLEQARKDPRGFHDYQDKKRGDGAISMMRDVVSPAYFKDEGTENCYVCQGRGEKFLGTEKQPTGEYYPAYQANPKSKGWHLEKNGQIITSGQSIAKLYRGYWSGMMSEQREAVQKAQEAFLTELYEAMEGKPQSQLAPYVSVTHGSVEILDYSEKAIAVFGDTKPLKDQLKAERGRFNAHLTHPTTKVKTPGWIFSKRQRPNVERLIQSL